MYALYYVIRCTNSIMCVLVSLYVCTHIWYGIHLCVLCTILTASVPHRVCPVGVGVSVRGG